MGEMENQTVQYLPIQCKTALHSVSGVFPYKLDLNIYRGCENGCKYCFAIYSHKYMNKNKDETLVQPSVGYYDHIYVKTNVAEQLDKELSRPNRRKQVINIGGICDSYQKAEETFELMPDILKVMIKHKNPIIISTKSDLILRDYDLIDELSKYAFVNIASTITTADESVREKVEPGAVSTKRRFDMLEKFKKTDVTVGVHMMPVLPFLTDSPENLESIFSKTKEIGAEYIIVQTLSLRNQTKKTYFEFIKTDFPEYFEGMKQLYKTGGLDKEFNKKFYSMANPLLKKYELSTDYMKPVREEEALMAEIKMEQNKQKTLFDF
ncbi:SPL family radical SAM protein [Methanimicrococcus blatticola]|uniref:DNA repair photolyase n=1 Tax=Methanimicrococcus blatticola TaxID=91560 RepID=A0A484F4Z1_9EURY|nr:radical SAM protein [Methanimicrococcus blatticola]MBZ3936087.1 radical SAM protein [Methanimicrococcus blatticola]MCC2509304.1 radical SAM protein [Methanimicrococcus blatticola]TDQ68191.1 DNA repair photolyase [Methanimicrococcus blatticola]